MLENVFSWSKSRDEQFRECQRKYYYDKYASWGGWEKSAPPTTRLAYVYKNLKNRWAWKGETVHHVIEDVLKAMKAGRVVPFDEALECLTGTMRKNFRASKAKKYFEDPKRNLGLFEHEYEKSVTDDAWRKIHDESATCLKNFYESPFYAELVSDDKASWLVIEDLEDFEVNGVKVYVKLDFARKKKGRIEIIDWKTGKSQEADTSVQMGCYALYAMKKWGVPLADIRAYIVNLMATPPMPVEQPLTEESLAKTRAFMAQSISGMQALLEDPKRNTPKPAKFFLYTENTQFCGNCNFYKICEKYTSASPSGALRG